MRTRDEILSDLKVLEEAERNAYNRYRIAANEGKEYATLYSIWESANKSFKEIKQELLSLGAEGANAPDSFWVLDVPVYTGALDSNSIQKEIDKYAPSIVNPEDGSEYTAKEFIRDWHQSLALKKFYKYQERPDADNFYEYVKELVKYEEAEKAVRTDQAYVEYLYTLLEKQKTSDKILEDAVQYYNEDVKDDGKNNGSANSQGKESNNIFINHYKDLQKKEQKEKVNIFQLLLFGGAFYFLLRE
jgi:hypothetical protein